MSDFRRLTLVKTLHLYYHNYNLDQKKMKLLCLLTLILLVTHCLSLPINKRSQTKLDVDRDEADAASDSPDTNSEGSCETSISPTESADTSNNDTATESVSTATPLPSTPASSRTPANTTAVSTSNISSTTTTIPTVEPSSHPPTEANINLDLETVAMDTSESARYVWQAAIGFARYILTEFLAGQRPRPRASCFLTEREPTDRRTHHDIDYVQRFIEDYNSLEGYYSYTEQVESTANSTTDMNVQYNIQFTDLKDSLTELKENMASLFSVLDRCGLTDTPSTELQPDLPEFCSDTSYEQQYRVYLRCDVLARLYIPSDINGLQESIKNCATTN